MATAKVIAHSFKIKWRAPGSKADDPPLEIDSAPTVLLARWGKENVHVSVPVLRASKPAIDSTIEITEPVKSLKANYNEHGRPIEPDTVWSANLLTKTTSVFTRRDPAKQPAAEK